MSAIDTSGLKPAFARPVYDSQASFRCILDAMAYPGRIGTIGRLADSPEPLGIAAAAVALTLTDFETPVWLDLAEGSAAASYLRFHTGAPLVRTPGEARFAIITRPLEMPVLGRFDIGADKYPDSSATLVIEAPSLTGGPQTIWSGPGIDGALTVRIAGLPAAFWREWSDNHGLYPQGVDVIFCAGRDIIGLPRGIRVEE
jgi:alpha-D-ribose 1-methylphosphonate 5-triphosphate synthase subunit PhnH